MLGMCSTASASEIVVTGLPDSYNVYYRLDNPGVAGREVAPSRYGSGDFSVIRLQVPNQYITGFTDRPDVIPTLRAWHEAEGLPTFTRNGSTFRLYPFITPDGNTRYMALEHLYRNRSQFEDMNMTYRYRRSDRPETDPRPPAVDWTSPDWVDQLPDESETGTAYGYADLPKLNACAEEFELVNLYRDQHVMNTAPESTAAWYDCLEENDRTDVIQRDREIVAALRELRAESMVSEPTTDREDRYNTDHSGQYASVVSDLERMRSRSSVGCSSATSAAQCMVCNCHHEAGIEGQEGKVAVNRVILTRVAVRGFSDSICGVVWQHAQFSWTLDSIRISYRGRRVPARTVPVSGTGLNRCIDASITAIERGIWRWDHYLNPRHSSRSALQGWYRTYRNARGHYTLGRHVFVSSGRRLSNDHDTPENRDGMETRQ